MNYRKMMGVTLVIALHLICNASYALQVTAAEAGSCTFPDVGSLCQSVGTKVCNRTDNYSPVSSHATTVPIANQTTDNCDPNASPRPVVPVGASSTYNQTYSASISAGISGGEDVKNTLNGTLGYSAALTVTNTGGCTSPDVEACRTVYVELRANVDPGRTASVNHAYSCTLSFGFQSSPVCSRCTDCTAYNNQSYTSSGCSGNSTSSVSGDKFNSWYCPTVVNSQCTNECCNQ